MHAADDARLKVWARQPKKFFERATIDLDGTLVMTTGECKAGMDISYKGTWGYHPLLVSLAETGEVLRLVNRSGNRPSHEGAAAEADEAIAVCRKAGFRKLVLRGDTAFSQAERLDGWDSDEVTFYFGFKALPNLERIADELPETAWKKLRRPPRYKVKTEPRRKPLQRQAADRAQAGIRSLLRLESEEYAEFRYQPLACDKEYRMVVVRKNISHEKGETRLFDEVPLLLLHHQRSRRPTQRKWSSRPTTVVTRKTSSRNWPAAQGPCRRRSIICIPTGPTWWPRHWPGTSRHGGHCGCPRRGVGAKSMPQRRIGSCGWSSGRS